MRSFVAGFSVLLLLGGCGASQARTERGAAVTTPIPQRVTADNYAQTRRLFHSLHLNDRSRLPLRSLLVDHLERRQAALLESEEYDAVVAHLAELTGLFTPDDFSEGRIAEALGPPARFLYEQGSPPGDEARVLSALLILTALHPDDPAYPREYEQIVRWGREVREMLPNVVDRYSRLIDVWEEHARLTPSLGVLKVLAQLHTARRNALAKILGPEGGQLRIPGVSSLEELRSAPLLLRRAPLDVAGVYLQHGDVAQALSAMAAMGDAGRVGQELTRLLRDAKGSGSEAMDALLELADAYERARPEVALGICRLGQRRFVQEARFPVCLARIAAEQERYSDATAWYARAVELDPDRRSLYDEALAKLDELIEDDLFEAEPTDARMLAAHAERILEERTARWPNLDPPVDAERLHFLVGLLEMNAGNADEAQRRFEASIEVETNAPALLQLGILQQRLGRFDKATKLFQQALELASDEGRKSLMKRAEITEHLGDAARAAGRESVAKNHYRESLSMWSDAAEGLDGPGLSLVHARQGVLMDRLGQHDEAVTAFRQAMDAAPGWREIYATILSHLVTARPDVDLALEVSQRAQRHLALQPEWKVYFALWVQAIAARSNEPVPEEIAALLDEMSTTDAWWSRLARFGARKLPYSELLDEASNAGEEAESHFYEAARQLSKSDVKAARQLLEQVLQTRMVSFYEYAMAQELLRDMPAGGSRSKAASGDN